MRPPQACAQAVDLGWRRRQRHRVQLALFASENLVSPHCWCALLLREASITLLPFANIWGNVWHVYHNAAEA